MRVNEKRHPMHKVTIMGVMGVHRWKPEYGTRLRGYFDVKSPAARLKRCLGPHDDVDCLNDLEHAGLLLWISEANGIVELTEEGTHLSALIRRFKAGGGQCADFTDWLQREEPGSYNRLCGCHPATISSQPDTYRVNTKTRKIPMAKGSPVPGHL
jgi:hypothetical protein